MIVLRRLVHSVSQNHAGAIRVLGGLRSSFVSRPYTIELHGSRQHLQPHPHLWLDFEFTDRNQT